MKKPDIRIVFEWDRTDFNRRCGSFGKMILVSLVIWAFAAIVSLAGSYALHYPENWSIPTANSAMIWFWIGRRTAIP